jgi:hypothetical protein
LNLTHGVGELLSLLITQYFSTPEVF